MWNAFSVLSSNPQCSFLPCRVKESQNVTKDMSSSRTEMARLTVAQQRQAIRKASAYATALLSSAGYNPDDEEPLYTVGTNAWRLDRILSVKDLMERARRPDFICCCKLRIRLQLFFNPRFSRMRNIYNGYSL